MISARLTGLVGLVVEAEYGATIGFGNSKTTTRYLRIGAGCGTKHK